MKSYTFCSNCGKNGHSFSQCKHPITSIGIIAFRIKETNIEYLMIRRKDTLGFVDFMRGKYSLNNKRHLMNIIDEMTMEEKKKILNMSFEDLWSHLWGGNNIGIQYRSEKRVSREKFILLKEGISYKNINYCLESLIKESKTNWKETEWGYPKGRRNYQEKDIRCALREFSEETGYNKSVCKIVNNLLPFEETFTGSNYKSYKHRYYVAYVKSDAISETPYQNSEVSCVEWKTYPDAIRCIRSYNLEKIKVLQLVNNVINKYSLYH
tara:strand:- start:27033 stop:27830 length:798 start_codon:yes stop_codon:yes gene_type:complete